GRLDPSSPAEDPPPDADALPAPASSPSAPFDPDAAESDAPGSSVGAGSVPSVGSGPGSEPSVGSGSGSETATRPSIAVRMASAAASISACVVSGSSALLSTDLP